MSMVRVEIEECGEMFLVQYNYCAVKGAKCGKKEKKLCKMSCQ